MWGGGLASSGGGREGRRRRVSMMESERMKRMKRKKRKKSPGLSSLFAEQFSLCVSAVSVSIQTPALKGKKNKKNPTHVQGSLGGLKETGFTRCRTFQCFFKKKKRK